MVGIVIVSHSKKAAEGIRELAVQMSGEGQQIIAAGGVEDGSIGTDAVKIRDAIKEADTGEGVLVMVDLGSAVLSTNMAIELLTESGSKAIVKIADAPVLEGAISAAVQASIGDSIEGVAAAAEEARSLHKA
ncbi:MAG: dihydroxyacetone kinase phosphoryl donor subunit DhaM [Caulobacteraceae bacterium]